MPTCWISIITVKHMLLKRIKVIVLMNYESQLTDFPRGFVSIFFSLYIYKSSIFPFCVCVCVHILEQNISRNRIESHDIFYNIHKPKIYPWVYLQFASFLDWNKFLFFLYMYPSIRMNLRMLCMYISSNIYINSWRSYLNCMFIFCVLQLI